MGCDEEQKKMPHSDPKKDAEKVDSYVFTTIFYFNLLLAVLQYDLTRFIETTCITRYNHQNWNGWWKTGDVRKLNI